MSARVAVGPINMSRYEIQNLVIQNLATDPTGAGGQLYWNTGTKTLKVHDGTTWHTIDVDVSGVQVGGDLGGTNTAPTVISTHLAAPLPIAQGGTNAITASAARTTLAAAQSGANSDLLSLAALTGSLTHTAGALIADTPVLTATQTWNAGGVTFETIKVNITNTASAAASTLLDLQVGGVSQHKIDRAGNVTNLGLLTLGSGAITVSDSVGHLLTSALAGTLAAAQFPALTGDVTTVAGALATTLAATTNGTLATLSALTLVSSSALRLPGNVGIGTAAPGGSVALAVGGNVSITGNLTVTGEVQYTDSTHINVGDAFLNLIDTITTHTANVDGGYAVKRYKGDDSATRTVKNYWSESNKQWQYDITDSSGDTLTTAVRSALSKQMTVTGDSSTTSFALTHNFNNRYPTVNVIDATTNAQVDADVSYTSLAVVTINFGTAPTTGQNYIVAITG